MRRSIWSIWLAGLLPVISVNLGLVINVAAGLESCFPYIEGCYSVSKGVRSGPGLWLFKLLALPSAAAMVACWLRTGRWRDALEAGTATRRRVVVWLGVTGAAFFLVYAAWLGAEGEVYRWLRRYGVVFYFAGTGLAQLLLVSVIWGPRRSLAGGALKPAIVRFSSMVWLVWALGVASAMKRKLIDDPAFLDRVENALEWNFSLALSLAFLGLVGLLRRPAGGHRDLA
jgi:hypothetical protein